MSKSRPPACVPARRGKGHVWIATDEMPEAISVLGLPATHRVTDDCAHCGVSRISTEYSTHPELNIVTFHRYETTVVI